MKYIALLTVLSLPFIAPAQTAKQDNAHRAYHLLHKKDPKQHNPYAFADSAKGKKPAASPVGRDLQSSIKFWLICNQRDFKYIAYQDYKSPLLQFGIIIRTNGWLIEVKLIKTIDAIADIKYRALKHQNAKQLIFSNLQLQKN